MKVRITKNFLVVVLSAGILTAGVVVLWAASIQIPDLDTFDERIVKQSTKIYDRTGEILLFDIHKNVQRTVVSFDDMSRHVKNATIAVEDAEFYEHKGIKPSAILRATFVNIGSAGFKQGGSTITQQVVKNSLLTSEKKISRKLKEWVLSIKLEQILTKNDILSFYLNEAPYGGNIYGIEEASNSFFDKNASELTLAESAYLAALPQAPTYYSPYGNNRDKLEDRKTLVLSRMLSSGFITDEEYEDAQKENVEFKPREDTGIKAPHFVMYVREYLENKYGERAVEERGFRVTTTLDYELQRPAEEIAGRHALENEKKFNAENASIVAVDPRTGQILVMVGSRDYFDEEIDGNFNVSLAHRQPGSAFKPFVYATAFKKKYIPETVIFDLETEFSTECSPQKEPLSPDANCYHPVNYDNRFRGPVSFRAALAQSINVASVKVLYLSGLDDSLRTAKDLGIKSLTNRDQYGLTLVLGGGEVSPLDMASAYSVFANKGIRNAITPILKIEDVDGNLVEEFVAKQTQVLDENIALQISDILSDNEARAPAFGERSYLYFPNRDVAVKTGTTNDYRDAWIVGYTPSISVTAWAGNNDNSPMEKKVAGFIVAPMWNEFMNLFLQGSQDEVFEEPDSTPEGELKPILRGLWKGGESYFVDRISGKLATEYTPEETREEHVITGVHSILYWVNKNDPLSTEPVDPNKDPQFPRWEYSVREWASLNNIVDEDSNIIPSEVDDVHTPETRLGIRVSGINTEKIYSEDDKISVVVSGSGKYHLSSVEFYLNGRYMGKSTGPEFGFSFVPRDIDGGTQSNTLRVVGVDSVYNKAEVSVGFSVSAS